MPLNPVGLPDGLEVIAWAVSPMLHNPTNMDTDHLGRIWVTEGVDYRAKSSRRPEGDRIMILEDTDMDGKAEKSTVLWQDPELFTPLGIAVFDNVVMVSTPSPAADGKWVFNQGNTGATFTDKSAAGEASNSVVSM